MAFKKDMRIGKIGEQFVVDKFKEMGFITENGDGKKVDLSVIIGEKVYTCEVKYDLYAQRSGNLAIEVFNTKTVKASGLKSTKCDFWIHVLSKNEILIAKCSNLLKFIEDNKPFREVINAGDSNAHILLYTKDSIVDCGLFPLSQDTLCKLLSN